MLSSGGNASTRRRASPPATRPAWPRIIESVDAGPAPLRLVLEAQTLNSRLATLRKRIADFEGQVELAASTRPAGEPPLWGDELVGLVAA